MNTEKIEKVYINPSLMIFFSHCYDYLYFARILPESNLMSTCLVASNDNEINIVLPSRPHSFYPNTQDNLKKLVTYIYNKECAKYKKPPIKEINSDEILYHRIIDLINDLISSKNFEKLALSAMNSLEESIRSLCKTHIAFENEVLPFDVAFSTFESLLDYKDDTITVSDLKDLLFASVVTSTFYFDPENSSQTPFTSNNKDYNDEDDFNDDKDIEKQ